MSRFATFFAAVLAVQAASAQADGHSTGAQAAFRFDGAQVSISLGDADASQYAARFAALTPACDPHCIAPLVAAAGIETLTEQDVLEFLNSEVGGNTGIMVDARMPNGRAMGFIPGSVSLPHPTVSKNNEFQGEILKALGARAFDDLFNFADVRSLVVYDGGPVQNDAGVLIGHLLEAGYPAEKIKYYRGGMQVWSVLGLTVQE